MGRPTIYICENKGADQLRGNPETDQRLCFCFSGSTILLLLSSRVSGFWPASVAVRVGLCRAWSEAILLVFPRGGSILLFSSPLYYILHDDDDDDDDDDFGKRTFSLFHCYESCVWLFKVITTIHLIP